MFLLFIIHKEIPIRFEKLKTLDIMTRLDLFDSVTPRYMKLSEVLNHLVQYEHYYDAQRVARAFPDRGIRSNLDTTAPDYGYTVTGNDVVEFESIQKLFPGKSFKFIRLKSHVACYSI